jgi:hypothetical protein
MLPPMLYNKDPIFYLSKSEPSNGEVKIQNLTSAQKELKRAYHLFPQTQEESKFQVFR